MPVPELDCCDAIDFDVEIARPRRNVDEDAGRRVYRKISSVDHIMAANFSTEVQYTVHFKTLLSDEPALSRHSFHLLKHKLSLTLVGAFATSPVSGSKGGRPET
jgi:hypothetical protein